MSSQLAFRRPPLHPAIIAIAILLFVLWLATVLIAPFRTLVDAHLVIDAATIPDLELWAPLTYALFPRAFLTLLFDVVLLYFFGAELAQTWTPKRWWGMIVTSAILGGLVAMPIAWLIAPKMAVGGFLAATGACLGAYCWGMWRRDVHLGFIEINGRMLLLIFLALEVLLSLFALDFARLGARLAAVGIGILFAQNAGLSMWKKRFAYWRVRRRMKVIARTPEDEHIEAGRKKKDGSWIN